MSVVIDFDVKKILKMRNLGDNISKANRLLADTVVRLSDPYVPYDSGDLKNNHFISPDGRTITYLMPYASKQWHGHFKKYSNNFSGLRGGKWTDRMMHARGKEVEKTVADYLGGRVK